MKILPFVTPLFRREPLSPELQAWEDNARDYGATEAQIQDALSRWRADPLAPRIPFLKRASGT